MEPDSSQTRQMQSNQSHDDVRGTATERNVLPLADVQANPRQHVPDPPYQDKTRPTPMDEILTHARDAAEFNRTINQQRQLRAALIHNVWHRHHQQPVPWPSSSPKSAADPVDQGYITSLDFDHDPEQPPALETHAVNTGSRQVAEVIEVGMPGSQTVPLGSGRPFVPDEEVAEIIEEIASEECSLAGKVNEGSNLEQAISKEVRYAAKHSDRNSESKSTRQVRWDAEEVDLVRDMLRKGHDLSEIATRLGRSHASIKGRIRFMNQLGEIRILPQPLQINYTVYEEDLLKEMMAEKCHKPEIAKVMGRTEAGIKNKIGQMRSNGNLPSGTRRGARARTPSASQIR
ncbi:hypothetical protein N0V93_008134 [Gnomoniopsis smithogilvyi]|uniref:Uncharacterized protein n=1 Tax=Gnomoniopsis smithogilvyi TaxID=1191159 RepID=A0A9W8YME5_9PEZI|nr:hypothetical protein N0V93_008134 [Gnomoniopsis smithogilvyi]